MGSNVTTTARLTDEPLATLVLEERHAKVLLASLVSAYGEAAEELAGHYDPDITPEQVSAVLRARAELDAMDSVLDQTGLWRERAVEWPCGLTANREWLIEQLQGRLEADSDMIATSADRSFATIRHYMVAVSALVELLEQLGVEEAR